MGLQDNIKKRDTVVNTTEHDFIISVFMPSPSGGKIRVHAADHPG